MITIEREYDGKRLQKVFNEVGWNSSLENANYNNHYYFAIVKNGEIGGAVVIAEVRPGIAECHIAKRDILNAAEVKSSTLKIMKIMKEDCYSALFCFIDNKNKAARHLVNRIGFESMGDISGQIIYKKEL